MVISEGGWLLKLAETVSTIITRFKVLLGSLIYSSSPSMQFHQAFRRRDGGGILIPPPNEHIQWIKAHV